MKHIIFSLFLLIILSGCTPPHIREAHRITQLYSDEMENNGYSLYYSGGAMMDDIQKFSLGYAKEAYLDLNQARILIIERIESILNLVNNDNKVRPYLHNYPFLFQNLQLDIFLNKNDGYHTPLPYISTIITYPKLNTIEYFTYDFIEKKLVSVHEETFEEALQIYNNKN